MWGARALPTEHHSVPGVADTGSMCMFVYVQEAEGLGQRYDAIIIGAGLIGVFTLAEAVRQGNKRVLVLDKADRCVCVCVSLMCRWGVGVR